MLEINSSPGTEGIEDSSGKNIVKELLLHFKDSNVRYTVPTQCGYHEVVTVKPFGDLVAKFDTGNGVLSVLHAEDIQINGKKISFSLNGKSVTTNLIKTYEVQTGGGKDERPVVQLDTSFAGSTYKFMFGLDDRSELGTDVLLNRFVMNKLNVMVNPQRKYLITTKFTLDN